MHTWRLCIIYQENELEKSQTIKKFGISEVQQKAPNFNNLDIILKRTISIMGK